MRYKHLKRLFIYFAMCLIFQISSALLNPAAAQSEIIYDIGDIYYFPDGSYGVVCYVDPDNPHRGWVVAMEDLPQTYAIYNQDVTNLAQLLGLEVTPDVSSWGQVADWHFHGYENTRKLRESGHSPAANAVQFYSGWYIPDLAQLQQWVALAPILHNMVPTMQGLSTTYNENNYYLTSTFTNKGSFALGTGVCVMNNETFEVRSDAITSNNMSRSKRRIRPVRDFQVEDAIAFWGPVDTTVKNGTMTVQPTVNSEYEWHVIFARDTFDGSGWAIVHPKYSVNDNRPWTYDTVCASPIRYTSVKNSNFRNLNISVARDAYYQKDTNVHTMYGCDSIIRIRYIVNPVYHFYDTATICPDQLPFHWQNQTLSASGDYEAPYKTSNGCDCDSIYYLHLVLNDITTIHLYDQVCLGATYTDNGFNVLDSETGTAGETITKTNSAIGANGCDSTTVLHLTVIPAYNLNESLSICEKQLPYVWRDTTFQIGTVSGSYVFR